MQATIQHWRGRAARISLAALVHIVAVLLAYFLSPPILFRKPPPDMKVLMLPSPVDRTATPKRRAKAHERRRENQPAHAMPPATHVDTTPLAMMYVSSDVYRASDISRIHSPAAAPAQGAADGALAEADGGRGEGPGGAHLYPVEWYREPTQAEMDTYLPKTGARSGYGLVACRTAPDFRVEDCREMSEGPPGSGFARSVRLASWQFRVRPPRIGGKPLIGVWIGIRYDMIEGFGK